jgi:hypothetical protein
MMSWLLRSGCLRVLKAFVTAALKVGNDQGNEMSANEQIWDYHRSIFIVIMKYLPGLRHLLAKCQYEPSGVK